MGGVELGELIDQVASQLLSAEERARGRSRPVMEFTSCELELAVNVERSAGAGVHVWVVEAGASGAVTTSHRIKVTFSPYGAGSVFLSGATDSPTKVEYLDQPVGRADDLDQPVGRADDLDTPVGRADDLDQPVGRADDAV